MPTASPAISLASFLLLLAAPSGAQTVTAVRSSLKVRQTDKVPLVSSIEIRAARNEFESFQVVVTAKSPLSAVTVTAPTLALDGSPTTTIPASRIRLYREQNTYFTSPSNPEGDRGWWPDALVPAREDGAAVFNNNGTWSDGAATGETRNAFPASQRLTGAQMTTLVYPWFDGNDDAATATAKMSNWTTFTKDTTGRTFSWFSRTFHYARPDEPGSNCASWTPIIDQGAWAHNVDPG